MLHSHTSANVHISFERERFSFLLKRGRDTFSVRLLFLLRICWYRVYLRIGIWRWNLLAKCWRGVLILSWKGSSLEGGGWSGCLRVFVKMFYQRIYWLGRPLQVAVKILVAKFWIGLAMTPISSNRIFTNCENLKLWIMIFSSRPFAELSKTISTADDVILLRYIVYLCQRTYWTSILGIVQCVQIIAYLEISS